MRQSSLLLRYVHSCTSLWWNIKYISYGFQNYNVLNCETHARAVERINQVVGELADYLEPYESFKARLEELEDHLRPVGGLAPEYPLSSDEIKILRKQAKELK